MVFRRVPASLFLLLATAICTAQTRDTPLPITADVRPPILLFQMDADFSSVANRRNLHECHVIADSVIDQQGLVYQARVASSNDSRCDEPVLAAIRQYRFRPAARNGNAVAVKIKIPVEAQLF